MKQAQQIRWNIETAAREFGINPRTLANGLVKVEAQPGEDGLFSTPQICRAVFSDYEQERTRLTAADADIREIDRAERRKEVVPVDLAFQVVSNMFFSIRRAIETSPLPNELKDEIFEQMRGLKVEDFVNELKFEEGEET